MIKKYTSGNPICTEAFVSEFDSIAIAEFPLASRVENGRFIFEFDMQD